MSRVTRSRALTLLEALIVVLIFGMLAAMLYPAFESLKTKMRVVGTVQRMKQFNVARSAEYLFKSWDELMREAQVRASNR